ncbi:MAG: autotransporter-associated beta strand repeat-containing protein, partial [Luteolibacter sp.]
MKPTQSSLGRLFTSSITVAFTALASSSTQADTINGTGWKGQGGNSNWSTGNSWDNTPPSTGGSNERNLFFGQGYKAAGGNGFTTSNNDLTSWAGYRMTFQDSNSAGNGTDGSSANDTAFTITGNGFTLFDFGGGNFPRIENDSFLTQTFSLTSGQTIVLSGGSNNKAEINPVNGNLLFSTGNKIDLAGSTQLQMFGGKTVTYNGIISSSGNSGNNSVVINGGTTAVHGAVNTYGGDTFVNSGTLTIASGGGLASGSAIRLGNAVVNGGGNASLVFSNGSGGVSVGSIVNAGFNSGGGTYLIDSQNTSGTNTISGNVFLDGALRMNQSAGGTLSISNATLDLKAQTLTLTGASTSLINIGGVIGNSSGSGQVVVGVNGTAGGPTVTLASASTYGGETFVRAGALQFTSAGNLTNSTIRLGSSSGTSVDASVNLTTLTGGTTITSVINPVTTSGSGALSLNSQNTSGTNTYSGHIGMDRNLTITQSAGGTLNVTQVRTLPDASFLLGTDIKGFTLTLSPAASGTINASGTIYNSTGNGNVTVGGAGTVILAGINTYSGTTSVSQGTLLVNNTSGSGTGSGTVGVSSGATLGGSGTISGAVTLTTATLAPGSAAATVGIETFAAGLALNSTSIFEWDMQQAATTDPGAAPAAGGTNPGAYDKVVLNGSANSLSGSGAVFKIVLGSGKAFTDAFWDTNKTWNNVFSGTG